MPLDKSYQHIKSFFEFMLVLKDFLAFVYIICKYHQCL